MNTEMMTTNSLIYLLEDLLMIAVVSIILLHMNWILAICALSILPLYSLIHKHFRGRIGEMNRDIRENYAQLSSEFHDSIAGIRVVRAFNLEEERTKQFNKYIREDRRLRIKTYTFNALFSSITEYLTVIGILLVLSLGGYFAIQRGTMTGGEVVAFYTFLGFLYNPIVRLSGTTAIIESGLSSINRIYSVLDTIPTPPEKENPLIPRTRTKGNIRFENVTFYYDGTDKPALQKINLDIPAGSTVALVGTSGGGKSTIINLITRFYDPTSGNVILDGVDLKEYQLHWLRKNISLVLQEGFLFWGTIRENIRYGRLGATDAEVEKAAELAYAKDFIDTLPHGLDTPLGERGISLSGGQKQRIAIARAILKNAPILILDEATSALDNESEVKIQKAMEQLSADRTTIVIAHRLSTIRKADKIVVMKDGEIAEFGSHNELIERKGEYYRLHNAHELGI
jgi:subfamily B ATP-binding cassette protein MsbA